MIKIGDKIKFIYEIDVPSLGILAMEEYEKVVLAKTMEKGENFLVVKMHFGTDAIPLNEAIFVEKKQKDFKKEYIKEFNNYSYKCLFDNDYYPYSGSRRSVHKCIEWYKNKGHKLQKIFNRKLILS